MDLAALPDDVIPLLAAGSNAILARLRVSRRLAAVCAPPRLERHGQVLRRGVWVLDLAAKHDAYINAPVLDACDAHALWEILGTGMGAIGAYKPTVHNKSIINIEWLNGVTSLGVNNELGTFTVYGTMLDLKLDVILYSMWTALPGEEHEPYYLVVNTTRGKKYWIGCRRSVNWFAARVESVKLSRLGGAHR